MIGLVEKITPPEAVVSVPPGEWSEPSSRASLEGARLNLVTELGDRLRMSGEHVKKIGSCELVTARWQYGRPFSFRPQAYQWFATNSLPRVIDQSGAFERRMLIVHFNRSLEREEVQGDFLARVAENLSSLVRWAAVGAARLLRQGSFTLPTGHALSAATMQHGERVAAILAHAGVEKAPGFRIATSQARAAMLLLCEGVGRDTATITDGDLKIFAGELRRRYGATRHQSNGQPFYQGSGSFRTLLRNPATQCCWKKSEWRGRLRLSSHFLQTRTCSAPRHCPCARK